MIYLKIYSVNLLNKEKIEKLDVKWTVSDFCDDDKISVEKILMNLILFMCFILKTLNTCSKNVKILNKIKFTTFLSKMDLDNVVNPIDINVFPDMDQAFSRVSKMCKENTK